MLIKTVFSKSTTAIALVLMATSSANAEDNRYDKTIEAALIAKAASKVGKMRKTISYDQNVELITRKDVQDSLNRKTSSVIEKIWVAPKPTNTLPPIVYKIRKNLDETVTASIQSDQNPSKPNLIWEKFDAKGNLIN